MAGGINEVDEKAVPHLLLLDVGEVTIGQLIVQGDSTGKGGGGTQPVY